ncbi:MAG: hypothetical protein ACOYOK_06825 [Pseudobdellovibrionaceae bacterium]
MFATNSLKFILSSLFVLVSCSVVLAAQNFFGNTDNSFKLDDGSYNYPEQQLKQDYYSVGKPETESHFYDAGYEIRCGRWLKYDEKGNNVPNKKFQCDSSQLETMGFRNRMIKLKGPDAYDFYLLVAGFRKPEVLYSFGNIVLMTHKMYNSNISFLFICTQKNAFPISMAQWSTDCFLYYDPDKSDKKVQIQSREQYVRIVFKDPSFVAYIRKYLIAEKGRRNPGRSYRTNELVPVQLKDEPKPVPRVRAYLNCSATECDFRGIPEPTDDPL